MNRDAFDRVIKYLVISIGVVFLLFILLSFFRMGFVFWFYERVFDWVSVRLGLDYYLALFISLSATTLFSASFPFLAWTFLLGRKQYIFSLIIIGITGLMCLLVYTVGTDVNFDRKTREPLKKFADTPGGRYFTDNIPGNVCDPKYGITLKIYTKEVILKEIQEKAVKESQELKRREKEAQDKALKENEERKHREAEEVNRQKSYIPVLAAHATRLVFFESGMESTPYEQRTYKSIFKQDQTRFVNWELKLDYTNKSQQINLEVVSLWHYPNGTVKQYSDNLSIGADLINSIHSSGRGCNDGYNFQPGNYTIEIFIQGKKIASGSFSVVD